MKEYPIPFSSEMIKAIFDGRKSETRRVLKVQPPNERCKISTTTCTTGEKRNIGRHRWADGLNIASEYFSLPYGQIGDRLWVREGFRYLLIGRDWAIEYRADGETRTSYELSRLIAAKFRAYVAKHGDGEGFTRWMPPMFMPRWASRIDLENNGKRVESLGDLTEESAIAEGIEPLSTRFYRDYSADWDREVIPLVSFVSLWESINGKESWDNNIRVLVLKFKVLEVKR